MIGFFGLFEAMFFLVFSIVIVVFVVVLVRGIGQWHQNNQSPVLTVDAQVVAKRADTSHHHHTTGPDNHMAVHSSTTYYVTFQVQSGDRMELQLYGQDYGVLREGDFGRLTFQGTRFKGFVRR